MKRLLVALMALSVMSLIAGCSSEKLNAYIQKKAADRSDIKNTEEYKTYEELLKSGKLDEEGRYNPSLGGDSITDDHSEKINVTFARNSFIKVFYYADPERTVPIDPADCWLKPGDSIYAPQIELSNSNSHYVFSCFHIIYDEGDEADVEPGDGGFLFTVPEDYAGERISVMPMGKYLPRVISLNDYYLAADGKKVELSGKWTVNGKSVIVDCADVNSISPCTVTYDYGEYADDYYFVKGAPSVSEVGTDVSFNDDGSDTFSVEMHQYIIVSIDNVDYNIFHRNIIKSVSANGESDQEINVKAGNIRLDKRRCGDQIVIRVDSDYKVGSPELSVSEPVSRDGGSVSEYRVTIPDTVETLLTVTVGKITATLDKFAAPSISNASLVVTDSSGRVLQAGDEVDDNEKLTVEIRPSAGYYVTGKNVKNDVYQDTMKYRDYIDDIDDIIDKHEVKKLIRVTLSPSDDFGTCVYSVSGKEVSVTAALHEGDKLKLTYTVKDGYKLDRWFLASKTKYTDSLTITADMDGKTLGRQDFEEAAALKIVEK